VTTSATVSSQSTGARRAWFTTHVVVTMHATVAGTLLAAHVQRSAVVVFHLDELVAGNKTYTIITQTEANFQTHSKTVSHIGFSE